ncbi:MAG: DUF4838 domain-containing protein [Victivallales bacterium]|nr:DUF4838 domain-containing protein [Victivallales bacterium]
MQRYIPLLLALTLAAASALDLAQHGKPADCSIVISENAAKPYESAAKELQKFVEDMTGVKLPIVRDSMPLPPKSVLIGSNRHTQAILKQDYKPEALGDDAYIIKVKGNHLVILGNKRGGQYGVYDILERFGGCQWYSSWCSKIPKHDKFAVPDDLDVLERPAFMMREPFWFDMFNTMQAVRNRCNGNRMLLGPDNGGKIAYGAGMFVHTFEKLIPPKEFFATHPEYFSEIGGKRMQNYQLCLSNPDVRRIVIERLQKIIGDCIAKDSNAKMFSVSQNDVLGPCECKECKALVEKLGNQSDLMIWFVNQVAEEIEKEYPDVFVETLAYQYTRNAPKTVRPRSNVIVCLCSNGCDYAHPIAESGDAQTIQFVQDIKGWSTITDKLFIWTYSTSFSNYITPFPNVRSLMDNIRFFKEHHAVAIMTQGSYHGYHADFSELKGWLGAKLMWNTDANVEAYLNDFFGTDGYYGSAGSFVRQYFEELHALVQPKNISVKMWLTPNVPWLSDNFLLKATELFRQAEAAVKDDPVHLYNVRKASLPVYFARYERLPVEKIRYAWNGHAMAPANINPLRVELAKELLTRFDEKLSGVAWPIRIAEDKARHQRLYQGWQSVTREEPGLTIKNGQATASVIPNMDGMLAIYQNGDKPNAIDSLNGGITYSVFGRTASLAAESGAYDTRRYTVLHHTDSKVAMQFKQPNHSTTQAIYSLMNLGKELRADFSATCEAENGLPYNMPTASFPLSLGVEGNFCYKIGDGPWKEHRFNPLFKNDTFAILPNEHNGHDSITVASPKTGRAATIKFGAHGQSFLKHQEPKPGLVDGVFLPEKNRKMLIQLQALPETGSVKLSFVDTQGIVSKDSFVSSRYTLRVHEATALPPSIPLNTSVKNGIQVRATELFLLREGQWCYLERDDESLHGVAIHLTSNHFQWCLRIFLKELDFLPNTKYKVRIRVKLEKNAEKGHAFEAGLYDDTAERYIPGIKRLFLNVEDAEDGYQWYDLGAFTPNPEHTQIFWAAPGRFDKNADGKPAVKHIMFDCVEFLPTE